MKNTDGEKSFDPFAYALRVLTRRDCCEAELLRKLAGRGVSEAAAVAVINRLKGAGYLDDRRYAEQLAGALVRNGRRFGLSLRMELLRRGIPEPVVDAAMAAIAEEHDEEETLRGLAARKFPAFDFTTATDREKRRVVDYLRRRGFSLSVIMGVLRERACPD